MDTTTLTRPRTTAGVQRRLTVLVLVLLAALAATLLAPPTPADAAPSAVREAQTRLRDLGYPVGAVDGIDGAQTRRGLCAWRRLSGVTAHRGPVTAGELAALRTTTALPAAATGRGVTVDKTCQVVFYRNDGRWQKVLISSTGTGGLPRNGDFRIQRVRTGWHTSTLYPAAQPNMYSPMHFDGAIALHGARQVPATPASKGCARLTTKGADWLHARLKVGDPVQVIGSW